MRVLFHCNGGDAFGMGHVMRTVAIAEEAQRRGWRVEIVGDLSERAAATITGATGVVPRLAPLAEVPAALAHAMTEFTPDVLHLDTYWLDEDSILSDVPLVSNMQDGAFGVRRADIAVDANIGAEVRFDPSTSRTNLVGSTAALVRSQVRRWRDVEPAPSDAPKVLVVLGGTDPGRLTTRVASALADVTAPLALTVISPADVHPDVSHALRESAHSLTQLPFVSDLPAIAHEQDLIISAAGTSLLDFACMGVPVAAVCVADNQVAGYRMVVDRGMALGLGGEPFDGLTDGIRLAVNLLADSEAVAGLRRRLRQTVDGLGVWRLAEAWEQLRDLPERTRPPSQTLRARVAVMEDAATLFDWRNDPATRAVSRNTEPVPWEGHMAWLESVLENEDRHLLVIEDGDEPVATVRWDRDADGWEASITTAPHRRGHGLGSAILLAAEDAVPGHRPVLLKAAIRGDNQPSRRLFARAGYLPHTPEDADGFATYAKWRFEA